MLTFAAPARALDAGVLREPWAVLLEGDSRFVSCVNGAALVRDGNGYITEFASDGGVLAAKWGGAVLNAPKGLAVIEGRLYVADLDVVRVFDRKTGALVGEVKVLGGSSIEGLAAYGSRLYLIDSGLRMAPDAGLERTGTDGLYAIETRGPKPVLKTLFKSRSLGNPRGVAVNANGLYVASSSSALLFAFDFTGRLKGEPLELPHFVTGGVVVKENEVWVSTNEGVLRGTLTGENWWPVTRVACAAGSMALDEPTGRLWVPAGDGVFEVPWSAERLPHLENALPKPGVP